MESTVKAEYNPGKTGDLWEEMKVEIEEEREGEQMMAEGWLLQ